MGLLDVKLRLKQNGKWDLWMDNAGRISTVEKSDKLALQAIRSVMNRTVFSGFINTAFVSLKSIIISNALETLRRIQIVLTNEVPDNLDGFHIYKSLDGLNFQRINPVMVLQKFIDEDVKNGREYFYGFTTVMNGVESDIFNTISVIPTKDTSRKDFFLLNYVLVQEDDGRIIFYFKNKRKFDASELLDKVKEVRLETDKNDPRKVMVKIVLVNLAKSSSDLTINLGSEV